MNSSNFIEQLQSVMFPNMFNPYKDFCMLNDRPNACNIRSQQLKKILDSAIATNVDAIWVGRDLGYRGGRRTGLALTDDMHLIQHGLRWSLEFNIPVATSKVKELTASVIWDRLNHISVPIFLWNVFPFHPHEPGNEFSNRLHNRYERNIGLEILSELIRLIKPYRLVAIGNDAAESLKLFSADELIMVRHPSYGGQNEFRSQINDLYNIKEWKLC
ncbi:MAG: uracil-DNA glycosylase [Alphaproteobacteria bacterium]|nr:uracil-DNA glycosylase [Alphaproteobacteria bacterium]